MKQSSSSSMSEISESKVMLPCSGNWDNILNKLYVDLFNLIVESRIPGANERGYGSGYHCPPLLGTNVHLCDLMKPECRKHQTMIHHLLRAVTHHVFEIEVLMLPDCCSDSKLSERIQNKEYVLLERWSMTFLQSDKTQSSIEVLELLRAVRSFLHFSQISAWLSSTKGKSPANVYYWVKPTVDTSSTEFENVPVVHFFPVFKINDDLCGIVKVDYPSRKQFIPIIPCSKHPPLQSLKLKLTEDPDMNQDIPLNQHIKHLQNNCDNQQQILAVQRCATVAEPLKTNSAIVLQSAIGINKTNRILRHSKMGKLVRRVGRITSKPSCGTQINKKNETSMNSETVFLNNHQQIYSSDSSRENLLSNKASYTSFSSRKKSKIHSFPQRLLLPPFCKPNCVPFDDSNQHICDKEESICSNILPKMSCSEKAIGSSSSSLLPLQVTKTNLTSINSLLDTKLHFKIQKSNRKKSLKRKRYLEIGEQLPTLKEKRQNLYKDDNFYLNDVSLPSYQNNSLQEISKVHCPFRACLNQDYKLAKCVQIENKRNYDESKGVLCYQNAFNSSKFSTSSISLAEKAMEDALSQSVENDLNLNWKYNVNPNSNVNNHKFVKLKLVNTSEQNTCANQIPDKTYPAYCDNINFAKSIDCEFPKYSSTNLTKSEIRPSSSCSSISEIKTKYCVNNSHESNETSGNSESDFRNKLKKTQTYFKDLEFESVSIVSDSSFVQRIENCVDTDLKNYKRKNCDSNASYESRTFKKLNSQKSFDCETTCVKNQEPDNPLELKTLTSISKNLKISRFKNSSGRLLKTSIAHKILKNTKKTSRKASFNSENVKSKSLDLASLNNYSIQNNIADKIVQNVIPIDYKGDMCKKQNSLISKLMKDSSLKSISNKYKSIDKNSTTSSDTSLLEKSNWRKSILCFDSKFQQSLQRIKNDSTSMEANLENGCSSDLPINSFCNVMPQKATPYFDCFPRHKLKFARGRKLLGNFEESILKGCFIPVSSVKGFRTEIGASGGFCPNHITLPADVSFYDLEDSYSGITPYMAHVDLGEIEYYVPKKGAVQVTLFNPAETVVKMFVLNYDLSDIPPLCHTFIRQKTYYMPVGSSEDCPSSPKWLRFILHLRFASSKTGKLYLHKDFKIVVLNKSNDDAASEFNQEPRELRSFLHVPKNPAFSNL